MAYLLPNGILESPSIAKILQICPPIKLNFHLCLTIAPLLAFRSPISLKLFAFTLTLVHHNQFKADNKYILTEWWQGLFAKIVDLAWFCINITVRKHLSSPRAESARAFTGRRCPHSGRGKDFLSRQPDFFTETAVTPEQKVEKSFPRWEINRHVEG